MKRVLGIAAITTAALAVLITVLWLAQPPATHWDEPLTPDAGLTWGR